MQKPQLKIIFDREVDGRWIAEVPRLRGVLAYGKTQAEARRRVSAVALRTIADRLEQGGTLEAIKYLFANDTVAGR